MTDDRPTFISLFAGIGGADLGFERAGWRCVAQVEQNPWRRAVLTTHFPGVLQLEDVRTAGQHNLPHADLIVGGFPCQDLSVAGKRAGLAGERSGLFFEFARILSELRPLWCVIENVPGLLSSRSGRDFAVVLSELDKLGYGLAWRVLDSQHFGVPQRRRRVFIVGHLGSPCPAEVLFESESCGGDSEEDRGVGVEIAPTVNTGVTNGWPLICAVFNAPRGREVAGVPRRMDVPVCTCPDTPRYQALGDAMTVNVLYWLAKRIKAVMA